MCKKAILENEFVPDCYKNQHMCDKAVDNYTHALKFVLDYYINQKMCDKGVNTYPSTIKFVLEGYKTLEMFDKDLNRCILYLILFRISIKLQKCVTELFLKILF